MSIVAAFLSSFLLFQVQTTPDYTIEAIRYGTLSQYRVASLVVGSPGDERMDIAMVVWLIRGGGRTILVDTGFFREGRMDRSGLVDYLRPDEAVRLAGVEPHDVTDIIITHAHWDHAGAVELFPEATVWIQRDEYVYYTGDAWQEGGRRQGDREDMLHLVERNMNGKLRLVDGDDQEILPGIRVYTGARHTYASQYVRVGGDTPFVLASDNCYLYRNLETSLPVATFTPEDRPANVRTFSRMRELAGSIDRIIPGHDPAQFERFPTKGRIARIN